MTKKQKYNTEDNRGVAIYARKSRITNKGDSIGVQFKQCAEYAKRELHLDEEYTFLEYEDKGLSGYYSDRPDFQRMLHDIEMGKIRAVVCYKLDRIGRKTSDLLRLLDFLEKHKVDLLICSNNINTSSGVSKIFIQIFAVVAEFERDTLTERITDNMMELAKDGRWLGGNTPTGFTVRRVKTGSGKNKSAYSYLESIPEEKKMIQKLYEIFAATRSIKKTADKMNELGYRTKVGSKFNSSTTRLLLKNPVYCTADESAYNYFLEHNGGLCGDISDFDGQHGISAYNKTDQEKFEDADSTFISPKFVQLMSAKPLSEWIISVGRHEGFISSRQWIDTQNMLDDIAEKYNRPHRKTNALLAGLVYCPHCGKRLRVIPESNRWTNGKPRFKYVCPGYRAGECTFRAVDGVLLDEFVVKQLSHLADEDSEYFEKLLNQKASDIFSSSQNEKELSDLRKKKAQLEAAISNQVKNLREADDSLKRFIQEDVKSLTDELAETDTLLQKLEDSRQSQMYAIRDIEEIKERLLSFGKYAENAAPDVLVTLIQTFVERIYITDENDERHCHIFIKGCSKEDYDDFFRATGYIENTQETGTVTSVLPVCDSDECCKSDMTLELAGRLVDLRKKQGLSQEALGEKLGVSRQTISKWERGEASPDTDNLIALADLYGISLDELAGKARTTAKKKESVHVGFDGIHVENEEESVHIGPGGIHVETPTESCHLGPHEARRQAHEAMRRGGKAHVFASVVHLVLIAAYLCLGFFWNLWHPGWLILLLGPILTSFAAAIRQRSARRFAWPVVAIAAYLCLGFFWNLWHPGWVVFLSVPLYYMIAGLFAKGKDCRAPEVEPVAETEKEE